AARGRRAWPGFSTPTLPSIVGLPLDTAFLTLDLATSTFKAVSLPAAFQIGPAVATGCKITITKTPNSVTITVTSGGVPCVGTLVGAWLYDGTKAQQGPVAALGFKQTDANGQATF